MGLRGFLMDRVTDINMWAYVSMEHVDCEGGEPVDGFVLTGAGPEEVLCLIHY